MVVDDDYGNDGNDDLLRGFVIMNVPCFVIGSGTVGGYRRAGHVCGRRPACGLLQQLVVALSHARKPGTTIYISLLQISLRAVSSSFFIFINLI